MPYNRIPTAACCLAVLVTLLPLTGALSAVPSPDSQALQAALASYQANQYDHAIAEAKRLAACEEPAVAAEAEQLLVLCHLGQGDFERALATVSAFLGQHQAAADPQRARLAALQQQTQAAQAEHSGLIAKHQAALKAKPSGPPAAAARLAIAQTEQRFGRLQAAATAYEALLRSHPGTAEARRATARLPVLYELLGDDRRVAARALDTVAAAPEGEAAARAVAETTAVFLKCSHPAQALAWLSGVAEAHPQTLAAQAARLAVGHVRLHQERANPAPAAAEFLAAIAQRPHSEVAARAAEALAAAYQATGNHEPGVTALATLAQQHPGTELAAWCGRLVGRLCQAQGKTADADQAYLQVIDTYPQSPHAAQAVADLAALYSGAATYEKALARMQAMVSEHPGTALAAAADYQIGQLCTTYGRPEEADEAYTRLLGRNPQDAQLLARRRNLSYTFMRLAVQAYAAQDWTLAIRHFGRVLKDEAVKEDWQPALRLLAQSHQAVGDYSEATAAYRRLLGMPLSGNDAAEAQFLVAECLVAEGKWDEAAAAYRELNKRWPKSTLVRHAMERLQVCADRAGDSAAASRSGQ